MFFRPTFVSWYYNAWWLLFNAASDCWKIRILFRFESTLYTHLFTSGLKEVHLRSWICWSSEVPTRSTVTWVTIRHFRWLHLVDMWTSLWCFWMRAPKSTLELDRRFVHFSVCQCEPRRNEYTHRLLMKEFSVKPATCFLLVFCFMNTAKLCDCRGRSESIDFSLHI